MTSNIMACISCSCSEKRTSKQCRELFVIIRNDIIDLVSQMKSMRDYSIFTEFWNLSMRLNYNLPPEYKRRYNTDHISMHYISFEEHRSLCRLVDKKKRYHLEFKYYFFSTITFDNDFEREQQKRTLTTQDRTTKRYTGDPIIFTLHD